MLFRMVRYILGLLQLNRKREFTSEDLDRMDVAYDEELTVFDLERAQIENGGFVGMTATISHEELYLASQNLPSE